MGPDAVHPSTLYIGRLVNRYLAPAGSQSPEEVRSLCESAIAATLSESLSAALKPVLSESDSSLWFIRRLELDFAVNPEFDSRLAGVWAKQITVGLVETLDKGGDEVLRFPDRAAYLTHFLLELAQGSAWNKWYYAQFDGLRMLPVSAAMRTAICDSPETGLRALLRLQDPAIVLRKITSPDAARILAAFEFNHTPADESTYFQAIIDAWQTALGLAWDENLRALLLFLNTVRSNPELGNKTLAATAKSVCRLAGQFAQNHDLISALRNRDVGSLYRLAGFEHATVLAPLLRCPEGLLDRLLQLVADGSETNPETRQETRFTAFGGAFLLFPLLDQLPLGEATAGWPDLENVSAAALARFLVLIKCFGRLRASGCFHDSLIRDLMRIPPQITPEMVRQWLAQLSQENIRTFFRTLAEWHLETAAAEGHTFSLIAVPQKGAPVALLLDNTRGLWLFAGRTRKREEELVTALSDLPSPERLLTHDPLTAMAQKSFPNATLETVHDLPAPPPAPDLDYLTLLPGFGRRSADLALSVAAQGVLRLFACKLPGFARSSFNHLYSNFLSCCAAVEEKADQRVVFLGRPPLHLVLAMSGLNRCSYHLSWLDGRPCAIFPEG